MSLRELHAESELEHLHLRTVEAWSRDHAWSQKRRAFQDECLERLRAKVGDELVQQRQLDLERMETLKERVLQALPSAEPKSLEGLVGSLCRLIQLQDDMRSTVLPQMPPTAQPVGGSPLRPDMKPRLTDEEARAAATTIIRMRCDRMRAELAQAAGEAAPAKRRKKPPGRTQ